MADRRYPVGIIPNRDVKRFGYIRDSGQSRENMSYTQDFRCRPKLGMNQNTYSRLEKGIYKKI